MTTDLPPVFLPNLPLFSIVTPSYNQGKYIRQTIESVLTQDYPNIEYWVIDGGSSDETISILKEYEQDPRFNWISEKDDGQSSAINKGLARCRGSIFAWLCSDDLLLPHTLRRVAEVWRTNERPAVLYGLARYIDEVGNDLGYCDGQAPGITLERLLRNEVHPKQPATFVPTATVREVGGIDPTLHYAMDFDLWIKLGERLPFQHIPADMALYRLHAVSKTVANPMRFATEMRKVWEAAAQRGLLSEAQARSLACLFEAKVQLLPEVKAVGAAVQALKAAVAEDRAALLPAITIALKGGIRMLVGDKLWSLVRFTRSRLLPA